MIPQTSKADWSQMASARNAHGVMPNLRQVPSEGKRSPSSKNARFTQGFRRFIADLEMENPRYGKGVNVNMVSRIHTCCRLAADQDS